MNWNNSAVTGMPTQCQRVAPWPPNCTTTPVPARFEAIRCRNLGSFVRKITLFALLSAIYILFFCAFLQNEPNSHFS
jgi:hypothetical protein